PLVCAGLGIKINECRSYLLPHSIRCQMHGESCFTASSLLAHDRKRFHSLPFSDENYPEIFPGNMVRKYCRIVNLLNEMTVPYSRNGNIRSLTRCMRYPVSKFPGQPDCLRNPSYYRRSVHYSRNPRLCQVR